MISFWLKGGQHERDPPCLQFLTVHLYWLADSNYFWSLLVSFFCSFSSLTVTNKNDYSYNRTDWIEYPDDHPTLLALVLLPWIISRQILFPNTFGCSMGVRRVTSGGWCGYDSGITNSRWRTTPLYGPSSALMLACQMNKSCSNGLAVTPTVGMVSLSISYRSFNNLLVAKFYALALTRVLKTAVSLVFPFYYILINEIKGRRYF